MAHLPRYYHKAAALMAVHQSYESQCFFFNFEKYVDWLAIIQERTSSNLVTG
jgi:hypothetical protein